MNLKPNINADDSMEVEDDNNAIHSLNGKDKGGNE